MTKIDVKLGVGVQGCTFGSNRAEVISVLKSTTPEHFQDGGASTLVVPSLGATFIFSELDSLTWIHLNSPATNLHGIYPIGLKLHELVPRLTTQRLIPSFWTITGETQLGDGVNEVDPDQVEAETFLKSGTLWVPQSGLGFTFRNGKVIDMCLCAVSFSPLKSPYKVDPRQLALSKRPDLIEYLTWYKPHRKFNPVQAFLTLCLCCALIYFGYQGWSIQNRWNNESVITIGSTIDKIQEDATNTTTPSFKIRYKIPTREEKEIVLTTQDFYVPPEAGDTIELYYLPDAPDEVYTAVRKQDVAFIKVGPHVIATLAAYAIALGLYFLIKKLWRRRSAAS